MKKKLFAAICAACMLIAGTTCVSAKTKPYGIYSVSAIANRTSTSHSVTGGGSGSYPTATAKIEYVQNVSVLTATTGGTSYSSYWNASWVAPYGSYVSYAQTIFGSFIVEDIR